MKTVWGTAYCPAFLQQIIKLEEKQRKTVEKTGEKKEKKNKKKDDKKRHVAIFANSSFKYQQHFLYLKGCKKMV